MGRAQGSCRAVCHVPKICQPCTLQKLCKVCPTCTSTARRLSGWVAVSSSSDLHGLLWEANTESYGRKSQLRQLGVARGGCARPCGEETPRRCAAAHWKPLEIVALRLHLALFGIMHLAQPHRAQHSVNSSSGCSGFAQPCLAHHPVQPTCGCGCARPAATRRAASPLGPAAAWAAARPPA